MSGKKRARISYKDNYITIIQQSSTLKLFLFQNIQSTNWQTMRFKPPPPNSNIGWRVEFRPMEVEYKKFYIHQSI